MADSPTVNGKQAIRALENLGFRLDRVEGSHHMMVKDKHPRTVPVPGAWVQIVA
jgi:predicted RNA binding protein YcfA (HicA-like mRNA interferase family)